MNKLILATAATLAATTAPAMAQYAAPVPVPGQQGFGQQQQRVQIRAEVASRAQARFARADVNRDGFLTQAEAASMRGQARARFGQNRGQRSARAFERLDLDRDGVISRAEFESRQQQRLARRDTNGDGIADRRVRGQGRQGLAGGLRGNLGGRMFAMTDVNRDGRVSIQEATSTALRRFDMADLNRDGVLTPAERQQSRALRRAQRGRG